MIKIEELKLGNLINRIKTEEKEVVRELTMDSINGESKEEFEPIILTPEFILGFLGFAKRPLDDDFARIYGNYLVTLSGGEEVGKPWELRISSFSTRETIYLGRLRYLHDYQNVVEDQLSLFEK